MIFTVGAILMEKMAGLLERSLVAGKQILGVKLPIYNFDCSLNEQGFKEPIKKATNKTQLPTEETNLIT